ncbi:MAG: Type 1 glutamine amidotransferase-like domain-containing protein [Acidobacteriota bacterium]|nr:MAG: Type 1 glutamine amidotransferase-like domain-containing protein [Acidobacteriota bacterium]
MNDKILLGPQRHQRTVAGALEEFGIDGQVAVISAGWQERESELRELRDHVGLPAVNLQLHRRAEQIFEEDPELFDALRRRQQRLRRLQRLYRLQLDHALGAARELLRRTGDDPALIEPEREAAIEAVRVLDRHHLGRVTQIRLEFDNQWRLENRPSVVSRRERVTRALNRCRAVLIAGGHVAVLLNRVRLFGLEKVLEEKPVIAWSAGAMAIAPRIVLFHDNPPQGAGNAEVLDHGLGLYPQVIPLPHARRRLQLDDPVRVGLFARRLAPGRAVALDDGSFLRWDGQRWEARPGTRQLASSGELHELVTA